MTKYIAKYSPRRSALFLLSLLLVTTPIYSQEAVEETPTFKEKKAEEGFTVNLKELIKQSKKKIEQVDKKLKDQARRRRNLQREEKAREYYEKAKRLFEEGKFKEAKEIWQKAIKITEHPEMKGYIRESVRRTKKQKVAFEQEKKKRLERLEIERGYSAKEVEDTYQNAVKFFKQKNWLASHETFERVEEMFPDHKATRSYLMIINQKIEEEQQELIEQKLKEEAVAKRKAKEEWRKKLAQEEKERKQNLKEDAEGMYREAVSLYKEEKYVEAKEKFQKIEWILPNYKSTEQYLAKTVKKIAHQKMAGKAQEQIDFEQQIKEEEQVLKKESKRLIKQKQLEEKQRIARLKEEANFIYEAAVSLYRKQEYCQAKEKFLEVNQLSENFKSTKRFLNLISKKLKVDEKKALVKQKEPTVKVSTKKKQKKLKKEAAKLYSTAVKLYKKQQYHEANQKFIELQRIYPDYKSTKKFMNLISKKVSPYQEEESRISVKAKKKKRIVIADGIDDSVRVAIQQRQKRLELEAENKYQKAIQFFKSGRLLEAKRKFIELEAHTPDYQNTLDYLARIDGMSSKKKQISKQEKGTDVPRAEKRKAITKKSSEKVSKEPISQIELFYRDALQLYKAKKYKWAKEAFDEINQLSPGYKDTKKYLKRLDRKSERETVVDQEEKRIEVAKQMEKKIIAGEIEYPSVEPKKVLEKIKPKQLKEKYYRAVELYKDKKYIPARELFREIDAIYPRYARVKQYLIKIHKNLEKQTELLEIVQEARDKEKKKILFKDEKNMVILTERERKELAMKFDRQERVFLLEAEEEFRNQQRQEELDGFNEMIKKKKQMIEDINKELEQRAKKRRMELKKRMQEKENMKKNAKKERVRLELLKRKELLALQKKKEKLEREKELLEEKMAVQKAEQVLHDYIESEKAEKRRLKDEEKAKAREEKELLAKKREEEKARAREERDLLAQKRKEEKAKVREEKDLLVQKRKEEKARAREERDLLTQKRKEEKAKAREEKELLAEKGKEERALLAKKGKEERALLAKTRGEEKAKVREERELLVQKRKEEKALKRKLKEEKREKSKEARRLAKIEEQIRRVEMRKQIELEAKEKEALLKEQRERDRLEKEKRAELREKERIKQKELAKVNRELKKKERIKQKELAKLNKILKRKENVVRKKEYKEVEAIRKEEVKEQRKQLKEIAYHQKQKNVLLDKKTRSVVSDEQGEYIRKLYKGALKHYGRHDYKAARRMFMNIEKIAPNYKLTRSYLETCIAMIQRGLGEKKIEREKTDTNRLIKKQLLLQEQLDELKRAERRMIDKRVVRVEERKMLARRKDLREKLKLKKEIEEKKRVFDQEKAERLALLDKQRQDKLRKMQEEKERKQEEIDAKRLARLKEKKKEMEVALKKKDELTKQKMLRTAILNNYKSGIQLVKSKRFDQAQEMFEKVKSMLEDEMIEAHFKENMNGKLEKGYDLIDEMKLEVERIEKAKKEKEEKMLVAKKLKEEKVLAAKLKEEKALAAKKLKEEKVLAAKKLKEEKALAAKKMKEEKALAAKKMKEEKVLAAKKLKAKQEELKSIMARINESYRTSIEMTKKMKFDHSKVQIMRMEEYSADERLTGEYVKIAREKLTKAQEFLSEMTEKKERADVERMKREEKVERKRIEREEKIEAVKRKKAEQEELRKIMTSIDDYTKQSIVLSKANKFNEAQVQLSKLKDLMANNRLSEEDIETAQGKLNKAQTVIDEMKEKKEKRDQLDYQREKQKQADQLYLECYQLAKKLVSDEWKAKLDELNVLLQSDILSDHFVDSMNHKINAIEEYVKNEKEKEKIRKMDDIYRQAFEIAKKNKYEDSEAKIFILNERLKDELLSQEYVKKMSAKIRDIEDYIHGKRERQEKLQKEKEQKELIRQAENMFDEALGLFKENKLALARSQYHSTEAFLLKNDFKDDYVRTMQKRIEKEKGRIQNIFDRERIKQEEIEKRREFEYAREQKRLEEERKSKIEALQKRIAKEQERLLKDKQIEEERLRKERRIEEERLAREKKKQELAEREKRRKLEALTTKKEKQKGTLQAMNLPDKSHPSLDESSKKMELEELVKKRRKELQEERRRILEKFNENLENLYKRAIELYDVGLYEDAMELFSEIDSMKPNHRKTNDYIGTINQQLSKETITRIQANDESDRSVVQEFKHKESLTIERDVDEQSKTDISSTIDQSTRKDVISQALDSIEKGL